MKSSAAKWSVTLIALLLSSVSAADNYKFDPDHTSITWHVSHFGYSDVSGKVMAQGTLVYDAQKPEKSTADISVDTTKIVTSIPKLDDILSGKNFFDVSEFPTATFKTTKVVVTGKDSGKIYGTLTIRGIAKDVVLEMKLNQQGMHPFYHKPAMGFSGTTTIKRSDFGMRGYIPGVSDDTKIDIQAEAILITN